jgi:UDP-N-acetylmuramate dehydrogenase
MEKGIKGIVIKIDMKEIKINDIEDKKEIIVDAGVPLCLLAQRLLKEEITGFEELSGIPGTIGGAIVMNAGAYGKEMKDVVTEVNALDYSGKIHKFSNQESEFDYRHSKFSDGQYIILQTKLLLKKGKKEEIKSKMDELLNSRKEKQPIEYPNAGSTFKRGNDFITAKLIDEAGLKGYTIGGAQISEKHAGFIVNKGNATAQDVLDLVKYATEKVNEKFGKKIELEVKILGDLK